jgi:multiple sugar transport system permease protein
MINILWTRASFRSRLLVYVLLFAAAIFTAIPFVWSIINSVKTLSETFQIGAFIPFLQFQPTLDSWREVLADPQTSTAFINSCVISTGTTLFSLILGVPAAYALARYEFPIGSSDITLWFLSQRVLPPAVVLIPFYVLLVYLRLIDTWTGLILCYSTFNLAFVVVIMRDIFRDVSTEIEDAAKVEGATPWQIFWMIALPLSLDGLVVSSVLVFAFSWNEALFASALTSQAATPFSALVLASRSTRGVDFNTAAVNTLIGIIPPVIFYLFVQRYLARGLSFGAVKG